jgi:hypothetical protein
MDECPPDSLYLHKPSILPALEGLYQVAVMVDFTMIRQWRIIAKSITMDIVETPIFTRLVVDLLSDGNYRAL